MTKEQVKNVFDHTIEQALNRLRKKGEVGKTIADIIEKGILEELSYHEIDTLLYNYIENLKENMVELNELKEIENIVFSLLKAKEDSMFEVGE